VGNSAGGAMSLYKVCARAADIAIRAKKVIHTSPNLHSFVRNPLTPRRMDNKRSELTDPRRSLELWLHWWTIGDARNMTHREKVDRLFPELVTICWSLITAPRVTVLRQIMNNPFNHLTNLALTKRSLRRLGLVVLAGLMTLAAAQFASGTTRPTPNIQGVLAPTPPATQPGGEMFLQATVLVRGLTDVTFYLAERPFHDGHDVELGRTTAFSGTVGVAGLVPQDVSPGFYYVLACIRGNCVATRETIQIIGQALSAVDQSADTTILADPPGPEYFPETTDGMEVGSSFACPTSTHRQSPSSCVWVTTQLQAPPTKTGLALWYCPTTNPYPYLVAIGFDTLWEDRSHGFFLITRPASFTKYKTDFFGPFSFAGGSGNRGYALFSWDSKERTTGAKVQVRYVCSDRVSKSAYP